MCRNGCPSQKLRASYAEVGNDTDPYRLLTTYGIYTVIDDIKGASTASTIPLADLKPELIKSTEAGFDIRFFNNRLGADFTWYKKKCNQPDSGSAYLLDNR